MTEKLEEIFADVYAKNVWGGEKGQIYSGGGSDDENTRLYVMLVNRFIQDNKIKSVVDLGCGDFRVGSQILNPTLQYTGVDIVPAVVNENRSKFALSNLHFECLNLVDDALPDGELCLIRQVFQHLSNQSIEAVLKKASKYQHVLITDGIPVAKEGPPNMDKTSDNSTRVARHKSGLYLELPPFNQRGKVVLEYRVWMENLRTFYIRNT